MRVLAVTSIAVGPSTHAEEPSSIRAIVERYAVDSADLARFHDIAISPTRIDRLERLARETLDSLGAIDASTIDVDSSVDLALLHAHLERTLVRLDDERRWLEASSRFLPFAEEAIRLEEARWRVARVDARAAATAVHGIAVSTRQIRGALEEAARDAGAASAAIDGVTALRTASAVDSVRRALRRWFEHHDGFRPDFGWWVRAPYDEAQRELHDYGRWLREEVAGQRGAPDDPLVGVPIGRDALLSELAHEFVVYTPEELIAIAEREHAWCRSRLEEAAERLGVAGWREAIEHVKALHEPPGGQDLLVARQAQEAIEFVVSRNLVTVPPLALETWRVEMLSEERQRILPFAAYGGQHMLVAFPTESMDHRRKIESLRGNNRHFTRIVTAHELVPGHHLQLFKAARHNTHRRLFRTPFLVEGWALHWEMFLWDLGFAEGPEDEVGMLFWRMHRCARIVVSLGFHLGTMTPEEMVAYLVEQVGLEQDGATAEVRRYIGDAYGPLYQVAYMIGGLQMRALHRELVGGGTMSDRDFHDSVLRQNGIAIELIRAALRGEPPRRGHGPRWRFDSGIH